MDFWTRPGLLALTLNLLGAAAIGWSLLRTHTEDRPVWVLVVAFVSLAAWVLRSTMSFAGRGRRTALVLSLVAAVTGAFVAPATDGLAIVPAAVAVLYLIGDPERPLQLGGAVAVASAALVAVGAVPFGSPVTAVLGEMAGIVLAAFAGLSRRQFRTTEEQAALLRERDLEMREEAARVAIARDLHDVLAHSLGGLVIQLDAVDALLEAGDAEAARDRVVVARGLAADGLAEARRAVAALRDPDRTAEEATVTPADFRATLDDLVAAHRTLGGTADLCVAGEPRPLSARQATALQRALQEALSNARKHAPGAPVDAGLDWQTGRVLLTVSSPLVASRVAAAPVSELAVSGGGHGLEGMRERFAALPLGGSVAASSADGRFTVTAEARLA
ncbi:sensor histidine kinase [Leifsonia sp. TF02-11]|uniref:sensor histidine kinase n=1 Tax=Leifsonia sp. TF02-11 TaxID=2815212 RepID=UPI001AA108A6|nr:histidine kinase [Leifsonia sp. TF02-11]MBO1740289.1 two-component sensor histidine kinase [Leifsonia sp. TF02-11]